MLSRASIENFTSFAGMAFLPLILAARLRDGFRHLENVRFADRRVLPSGSTYFGDILSGSKDWDRSPAQADPLCQQRASQG